jgi:hypothetical protein
MKIIIAAFFSALFTFVFGLFNIWWFDRDKFKKAIDERPEMKLTIKRIFNIKNFILAIILFIVFFIGVFTEKSTIKAQPNKCQSDSLLVTKKDTVKIHDTIPIRTEKEKTKYVSNHPIAKSNDSTTQRGKYFKTQLISLEYAKFQKGLIAEIRLFNHYGENCKIINNSNNYMFFRAKRFDNYFKAIDTVINNYFPENKLNNNIDTTITCLFDLQKLMDYYYKYNDDDSTYQIYDTCQIGIWTRLEEKDTFNIIDSIIISVKNRKINNKDISRSQRPVIVFIK